MKRFCLAIIWSLFALPFVLSAAGVEMIPVFPEKRSLRLTPGDVSSSGEITFPAVTPRENYGVVLRFDCRILSRTHGGWTQNMAVDVNGKRVGMVSSEGVPRLLLRGESMKSSIRPEMSWWSGNKLTVFYAPESAQDVDPRVLSARDQKFIYTLDVSELLNYNVIGADDRIEGGEPNRIRLWDMLPKQIVNMPMLFKDIELCYVKKDDIIKASGMKVVKFTPVEPAALLQCNGAEVTVMPNGGIAISRNGETFFIESDFSYEAEPAYKNNRFNVGGKKDGAADWLVTVRQKSDREVTVKGVYKDYTIERTMTVKGHRIEVKDAYINTSGRDIGILWSHNVGRNGMRLPSSRLAGQSQSTRVRFFGSSNSTLYAAGENCGLGLLAEDTVSRAQLELRTMGNIQSMGSIGMGIAGGKSRTLEWAIYPLKKADYYELINQVRRDWQVNYTIEGPFYFSGTTLKSARIRPIGPWHNYDNGSLLGDKQYGNIIKKETAAFKAVNPDTMLVGKIETNLVPFDCRQVEWGKFISQRNGARNQKGVKYGLYMTPEVTRLFDAYSPYRDSVCRDKDGNVMYENYYAHAPFVNLMVQLEIGNERYKTFMQQIEVMIDELKMDGIYVDQFQPYIIGGFSEDRWDGCTVELAADGSIKRKRYSYALTGAAARGEIIRSVRRRGGVIITNGQPMSREEQNAGVLAFQEMENNPVNPLNFLDVKPPECSWQTISHLGTPIALGIRPRRYVNAGAKPEQFAQMQTKGIITALRNGLVYYFYSVDVTPDGPTRGSTAICDNMFPFTPEELHDGWVKGRERTITAISGTFPVNGQARPRVLYFDKQGFEQPNKFVVSGGPGSWLVEVKLDDWNEVAIMLAQD